MSESWTETTLGAIADVRMGLQLSPSRSSGSRLRPYLRAANVSPGAIDLSDVNEMAFDEGEEARFALRPGDVLLVEGGNDKSLGAPALVTDREDGICFQNTLVRLRVKQGSGVMPEYLYLAQTGLFQQGYYAQLGKGTTIKHLGATRLPPVPMSIPTLGVQRRIVDLMTHLDEHLANLRTERIAATGLHDALTEDLIAGFPARTVREIADDERGLVGGPFGSSLVSTDYVKSGFPVIRGVNMPKGGMYVSGPFVQVSHDKAASLKGNWARERDVVFTQRGTLGQVGLIAEGDGPFVISQSQMRLRPHPEQALSEYIFFAFSRPSAVRDIQSKSTATANPHINLGILAACEIPLPDVATQRALCQVLSPSFTVVSALGEEIARLDKARRSVLTRLLAKDHSIPEDYDKLLAEAA